MLVHSHLCCCQRSVPRTQLSVVPFPRFGSIRFLAFSPCEIFDATYSNFVFTREYVRSPLHPVVTPDNLQRNYPCPTPPGTVRPGTAEVHPNNSSTAVVHSWHPSSLGRSRFFFRHFLLADAGIPSNFSGIPRIHAVSCELSVHLGMIIVCTQLFFPTRFYI